MIKHQLLRYGWLALLVIPGLYNDRGTINVILYVIGITTLLSIVSHIIRIILFPGISLYDAWEKANDTPIGAGIVFFSICMLLGVIINAAVSLLR